MIDTKYEPRCELAKLTEHPRNPRRGDVGAVVESIKANGFYGAVVAQRSTGYVLAGNHRIKAARILKMETVPVMWIDCDDSRAVKILLADNRTSDIASYDDAELANLLVELADAEDLDGSGYDGDDIDEMLYKLGKASPDFEPANEPPRLDEKSSIKCPNCRHEFTT